MGTDHDDLIKIEEGQEPSGDSDDGHGPDHRGHHRRHQQRHLGTNL